MANSVFVRATGEVYVLNDGGEVDLDLGNYERYLNVTLSRDNNITTGKVYREVIEREVRRCTSDNAAYAHTFSLSGAGITWEKQCRSVRRRTA